MAKVRPYCVYQESQGEGPQLLATSFSKEWADSEAEAINANLKAEGIPDFISHAYVA